MFTFELPFISETQTQRRRNLDESKLTYAQYDGDIPADDDIADYYTPLKGVRLA